MNKENTLNIEHKDEPPSYLEVIEEQYSSHTKLDRYSSSIVYLNKKYCSGKSKKTIFDNVFIETMDNIENSTLKLKILKLKEDKNFAKVKTLRIGCCSDYNAKLLYLIHFKNEEHFENITVKKTKPSFIIKYKEKFVSKPGSSLNGNINCSNKLSDDTQEWNNKSVETITCKKCFGRGVGMCEVCYGSGSMACWKCNQSGYELSYASRSICYECNGTGKTNCNECFGNSYRECKSCKEKGNLASKTNFDNNYIEKNLFSSKSIGKIFKNGTIRRAIGYKILLQSECKQIISHLEVLPVNEIVLRRKFKENFKYWIIGLNNTVVY